ncbi:squalene-associated FAD-dependent desaturase [Paraburkholderia bannensis]|uniref:Squalene-associated FAD-dependent desaturase n=1 Tax=Paraburkholderia bannensis TaxID=765414 RepID=A0A7W9U0T7_9BURK|nr:MULTISPECIES: hydroxysqualene dehydroxylase HpnE [Paraburkholderia]MBB3260165.1 squalene-associated FAD-dependent desaturase [Paraburkholderia sp. WP4_3_2]MBB6104977.1 squalene-associated FAD-dependent desaturase [Paraburkholderia bannensis]
MPRLVHVIGAGLAGLAAAVRLQRRGVQIALHEAAGQAGGRCRSYYDRTLAATLDSGNHVVLAGHGETLDYARAIGAADAFTGPDEPAFAFMDLAARSRWSVRFSRSRLPLWIADANARVPGTRLPDYLTVLPLLFARPGRTVAQTMPCAGPLWERLLRPLYLCALNIEPRDASAELASAMLREALSIGGEAFRPLTARNGLSSAFIDPALRMLQHGGAAIRLDSPLQGIAFDDASRRAIALDFDSGRVLLGADEAVVLAVPGAAASALVPQLQAPLEHTAIITLHFAVDPPPGLAMPMVLINGTAGWLNAAPGRLSATIHDAGTLLRLAPDELAPRVWADVAAAASLPVEPLPAWQIASDAQAVFAATPQEELRRPSARTRWNNLTLAGDWTATGLPASIEGAIRSGRKAADLLLS